MTTGLLVTLILPMAFAVLTIMEHADDVSDRITSVVQVGVPAPPAWVDRIPLVGRKIATEWQAFADLGPDDLQTRVAPYARDVARWTLSKAGSFAAFFVHLLLTVIISALLYTYGESAAAGVRAFARRLSGIRGDQSITLAAQSIRAVALGSSLPRWCRPCSAASGWSWRGCRWRVS